MKKITDILKKYTQYEDIPYSPEFVCVECGKSGIDTSDNPRVVKPKLVGWCDTYNGLMAVFECPECHSLFRFHPHLDKFDPEQFDFYLGSYYLGYVYEGEKGWVSNAKELYNQLKNS